MGASVLRRGWLGVAAVGLMVVGSSCAPNQVTTPVPAGQSVTCQYPVSGAPARPVDPPPAAVVPKATSTATLEMAAGTVTITLEPTKAPCTVNNFEALTAQHYFDDTRCHRLTEKGIFVLQCGDPSATGAGGPGYTFADELTGKETYPAGTVAMANRGADTNGSQFFIVWADTTLPAKYTVFGTVDEKSLEVVQSIASQGVDAADGISPIADASIKTVVMG